jgi:EmrB/QacA subfamily drug resistance transporter
MVILGAPPASGRSGRRAAQDAARSRTRRRWLGLGAVLVAAFMQLLDVTVVNVAAPTIRLDLDATYTEVEWVVASYQLAFAAALLPGGRLGDVFGRRRVFVVGVLAFAATSFLCAIAPFPGTLVAARVAQGIAGAVMFPQVLSMIHTSFSAAERRVAFGMFGATVGLATVSGPLISGALVELDVLGLGWRPIFFLNVPLGLAAAAAAAILLPESRVAGRRDLDLAGGALAGLGLLLLVYPLIQGREAGWPPWTWLSMAGSALLLRVFWHWQLRVQRRGGVPMADPELLRQRTFRRGLLLNVVLYSGLGGFFFVLAVYLQAGFGLSAMQAGLTVLPFATGSTVASGAAVALAPRLGRRVLHGGTVLLITGFALFLVTVGHGRNSIGAVALAPSFVIAGAGLGALLSPLTDAVLRDVPHESAGAASGVLSTGQQVGGALGLALMGVLFFGQLAGHAETSVRAVSPAVRLDLQAAGVPPDVADEVTGRFARCFVDRSGADDPAAEPRSCRAVLEPVVPQLREQLGPRLAALAEEARRDDFATAMTAGGFFQILVFGTTGALLFLLPGALRYRARHGASRYRARPRVVVPPSGPPPRATPVDRAVDARQVS